MPGNSKTKVEGSEYKMQDNPSSIGPDSRCLDCFAELERAVYTKLKTYSNVHRTSGLKPNGTKRNVRQQIDNFIRDAAEKVYY
jgi:hypothetical protein